MENDYNINSVMVGINMYSNKTIIPAGFSTYIFTQNTIDKIGYFDENIYPAYWEDNDFHERIKRSKLPCAHIENALVIAGDDKFTGSCTLNSVSIEYRKKMDICYQKNEKYFYEKWGNDSTSYETPFNKNYSIKESPVHPQFFENQNILLGHAHIPDFKVKIIN
jgi:hypothetical protein